MLIWPFHFKNKSSPNCGRFDHNDTMFGSPKPQLVFFRLLFW